MILITVSAAVLAVVFSFLTVLIASNELRESRYARRLERLHTLLRLAGELTDQAEAGEWTRGYAIAQGRLRIALREFPELTFPAARGLTEDQTDEDIYDMDAFLKASSQIEDEVSRLIAAADRSLLPLRRSWRIAPRS
jgi:hypothetical protein